MHILIVDDSRAMRMIVTRTLRQAGFKDHTFTEAEDGTTALDAIRTSKPDLVLSDWNMPNMTGIELLTQITAEKLPVKFGFVTSESTAAMRDQAREAGALFLIAKPFTPAAFEDALTPLL
ncbi:MAG: response regulator [Acidobacteria bacterium]|nr:response regulator [Acidobacteriota bacterium]